MATENQEPIDPSNQITITPPPAAEEEKEMPKLRIEAESMAKAEKSQFLTPEQRADLQLKFRKAKRYGLVALHKVVSLFAPEAKS